MANSIAIADKNVYICGVTQATGEMTKAVFWKNGELTVLGDGVANDIAVKDGIVYVCGKSYTQSGSDIITQAVYWKNGVKTILKNSVPDFETRGQGGTTANAICVAGNDVFVAGVSRDAYSGSYSVATYWKNGDIATPLTLWSAGFANFYAKSTAYDITVKGSDVYIAGGVIPATDFGVRPGDVGGPLYWKNNKAVGLKETDIYGYIKSVCLNGDDVYTLPGGERTNAVYFKNGTESSFANNATGSIIAMQITFCDNIMYVCGASNVNSSNEMGTPGYWQNDRFTAIDYYKTGRVNDLIAIKI